ncbi:MAG: YgiQ family radical SAM protein [Pirellulales bacterium]|nr:YgiQ family radical SAM protein [Pirellulales bacterium]
MPKDRPRTNSISAFLPMTPAEVAARGWDAVDVVFVTGDAYVDHPSFAMALLGRLLEAEGFRVAILSQPDWRSCKPWKTFGRPRICFAVSAGNMDSMLNHYTANRKVRNDDAYSPGGRIGLRPDRATLAYCQRAREAFPGVPIIAGGVEASLRRLAHYDYWSDTVRRSILLDAKADLLVYGMGERPLVEIVRRLAAGEPLDQLRELCGVAYRLGVVEAASCRFTEEEKILPSYEQVAADKSAFAEMTRRIFEETNPDNSRSLVQFHGRETVVVNPPAWPLTEAEIDRVYGLPFTRRPHPSYGRRKIPAFETVKTSIQILRGCFGGCTFCSIAAHEGRIIQSRSEKSVLEEIGRMAEQPDFTGVLSDLGGPTANMYGMNCGRPEARKKCRRISCLHPAICPNLATDHGPLLRLMESALKAPGVKKALVASGIRMDLALQCPEYIRAIARHHTGGRLKVAPEHVDPKVLGLMKKPPIGAFEQFSKAFQKASKTSGKEQYLVPYFIAGHPGCDLPAMIELALYLRKHNLRPEKVQDFIPGPMDVATCMYHTGLDPFSGKPVFVPRGDRQRRLQRALLQYYKPENYRDVRAALVEAGREDLIGSGPECLISERSPKIIKERPKKRLANRQTNSGYRPYRRSAKRRSAS